MTGNPPSISKPRVRAWREQFDGNPEQERRRFAEFARDIRALQRASARGRGAKRVGRGFHTKTLLAVEGELQIRNDLPEELQAGFLQPGERWPVVIRFSTSSHDTRPDRKRNGAGIAIRILAEGQKGDAQEDRFYDLLFSDSPSSHARDAKQFMLFAKVLSQPLPVRPFTMLTGLGVKESARLMYSVVTAQTFVPKRRLSQSPFWGKTPMRINEEAVKYQLRPIQGVGPRSKRKNREFFRSELQQDLDLSDLVYELCIQRFEDEQTTPIEDHSREWKSAVEVIGHLTIPQGAHTKVPLELRERVEQMAFSPWNTSDELRPLGSLNRARRSVYAASADNRIREREPAATERAVERLGSLIRKGAELYSRCRYRNRRWFELPPLLGVVKLIEMREKLRTQSLYDTADVTEVLAQGNCGATSHRASDGTDNDLDFPKMGSKGERFGRNIPDRAVANRLHGLPNARVVANEVLGRKRGFVPAPQLNLLAVAWIQFQVHDWFAHAKKQSGKDDIEVEIGAGDPWPGRRPIRVARTPISPSNEYELLHGSPARHVNVASHWWDGSQVYGADTQRTRELREPNSPLLKLDDQALLPLDAKQLPLTGSNDNWWLGLELMHTLFAREHNAICQMLQRAYPIWGDDQIFETARLVNVALIAKIHTIEWTPTILAHPTLKRAMDAHWWGLLGERATRVLGRVTRSELLSGIPGSRRDHFDVPFSLTEEFVSVYRMHPMLPDHVQLPSGQHAFVDLAFQNSRKVLEQAGITALTRALGQAAGGAMCLRNYPDFLRQLPVSDGVSVLPQAAAHEFVDVATLDLLRDRERGIPSYNEFRAQFDLPRLTSFSQLTKDAELAATLQRLYHHVDRVDPMVGMLAEEPPPGFGFSDTAFRVFVLMASRRLKSDRFFTDDYNEHTYTPEGLAWVRDSNMKSVLMRNVPELSSALRGVDKPFAPWADLQIQAG